MNATDALRASLSVFSSHVLLERLFFASVEFALLAALVFAAIRTVRIRSARLAALLWLVVLAKPIVSLAIGSPFPLVRIELPAGAQPTTVEARAETSPDTGTPPAVERSMASAAQPGSTTDDLDEGTAARMTNPRPEMDGRPAASGPMLNDSTVGQVDSPAAAAASNASPRPATSTAHWSVARLILALWSAGVAFFAGLSLLDRVRVRRLVRSARTPDRRLSDRYTAIAVQLGLRRPLALRVTDAVEGPALVGSLFNTILIPAWLADDSHDGKLDWALRHELMHWKLRDPLAGLVRELAQVLFYFHPVAWWAGRQWKAATERACDRAIVTSDADSLDYAEQLYRILVSIRGRAEVPLRTGLFATRTQIGQRIAALLNGPRTAPHLSALALVAVAVVTAVAIGTGGAFADRNLARDDSKKTDSKKTAPSESPPPSPTPAAPMATAEADVSFTYAGTVVDERGKPVAGAEIALDYWRRIPTQRPVPPLVISDATGKFEFSRKKSDFADAGELGAWEYARLIATKNGYGLAGEASIDFETTGRLRAELSEDERRKVERAAKNGRHQLKLRADDVPIHGRILDVDGQPVSGALVEAVTVWEGKDGSLKAWDAAGKEPQADYSSLIRTIRRVATGSFLTGEPARVLPAVRTDSAGWFTLKGLGRERIADLIVSGPRIETTELHVRSRRGDVVKLRDPHQNRGETWFYPCDLTCVVGPSVPIEGQVTDRRSRQPLAGIVIRANQRPDDAALAFLAAQRISTTSGSDGRYRLEGMPLGRHAVGALPPAGSRYLPQELQVVARRVGKPLVADFQLTAGTLIRGRVTDARTGLPLSGRLEYFAFRDNPFLKEAVSFGSFSVQNSYRSDPNGAFAIPVLPGRGIVTFWASHSDHFARGEGADRIKDRRRPGNPIDTAPYGCFPQNYNLLEPVDPRPGTENLALDLTLHSGVAVKGMVLAPDGQPVTNYCMYGGRMASIWELHEAETFEVKGYFPSDHCRLMFYQPTTNLVGFYELTGTPPANLEIKLHPGATITGRVVDADGQPLANLAIDDESKSTTSPASTSRRTEGVLVNRYLRIPERRDVTDQQGRFVLPGIIPGLKYSASVFYSDQIVQHFPATVFTNISAEPGETKDLGNLRYKPPSRADLAALSDADSNTLNAPGGDKQKLLTVRVTFENQPVAGAQVVATDVKNQIRKNQIRAVTDRDGRAQLKLPDDRKINGIIALDPKIGIGGQWFGFRTVPAAPGAVFEVPLLPASPYTLRVVDGSGQPVRLASIVVSGIALGQGRWLETRSFEGAHFHTDARGEAVVPWIPRDFKAVSVDVVDDRWKIDSFDRSQAASRIETVTVRKLRPVDGRLTMPEGASPEGLLITGDGSGGTAGSGFSHNPSAHVRRDGTFTLYVAPEYAYALCLVDDKWASDKWTGVILKSEEAAPKELNLVAYPATPLNVRVTRGPKHEPVADAWVNVRNSDRFSWQDAHGERIVGDFGPQRGLYTDKDGWAQFAVGRGKQDVFLAMGEWRETKTIKVTSNDPVAVDFDRPWGDKRRISGRLSFERPDKSGENRPREADRRTIIRAWDPLRPQVTAEGVVRSDGRFYTLDIDAPDVYVLAVNMEERLSAARPVPAGDSTANLELKPMGAVSGVVVGPDGKPLAGHAVQVVFADLDFRMWQIVLQSAACDEKGRFRFDSVPAGVRLRFVGGTPASARGEAFSKRSDEFKPDSSFDLTLAPGEFRENVKLRVRAPKPREPSSSRAGGDNHPTSQAKR